MNPDSIKPAGLPQFDQMATPPAQAPAEPSLATPPAQAQSPQIKAAIAEKTTSPKAPIRKQSSSNVALAIIATVIIVLGIAGLAVYAYLKSH